MADAVAVWALWRRLKRLFPAWSLLPSAFYTPGAWTMIGIDLVGGLRRNRSTAQTFDLLADTAPPDFEALVSLAAVNARRQDLILRFVLVLYVTLPLTALAAGADLAPDWLQSVMRDHPLLVLLLVVGATQGVLTYVCSWWRSHQMMAVLDLVRIERGLTPNTALELRGAG